MNTPDQPPLDKEARRLFLQASRELPPDIEQRLNQARRMAVDSATPRQRMAGIQKRLWWPVGALVVSCAGLLLWQPGVHAPAPGHPPPPPMALTATAADYDNELPPDAAQDDVGMYQDLAFYNWLASVPSNAP